jgi:hypothetical protein
MSPRPTLQREVFFDYPTGENSVTIVDLDDDAWTEQANREQRRFELTSRIPVPVTLGSATMQDSLEGADRVIRHGEFHQVLLDTVTGEKWERSGRGPWRPKIDVRTTAWFMDLLGLLVERSTADEWLDANAIKDAEGLALWREGHVDRLHKLTAAGFLESRDGQWRPTTAGRAALRQLPNGPGPWPSSVRCGRFVEPHQG